MAKEWGTITENLKKFAEEQKVFYIASASGDDDVNVSPKGVAPLRVVDEKTVIYPDYHGSGNQTARHISEGGKATLLFNSYGEKPLILRFYCRGRVVAKGGEEFEKLCREHYSGLDPQQFRQLFVFDVYRVQTSCGYGVPMMKYVGDRSGAPYFKELYGQ
ncbi:MAG: pyridoxamine 5'-phosphate oxidase family protein [Candidatus Nitrospinota bacterium M3_3B_026]